jgi:LysM repeat protein
MKILKIFGLVVGVHVFALILIFANPGCSSTTKPAPSPAATAPKGEPAPVVGLAAAPSSGGGIYSSTTDTTSAAPLFNPESPAVALPASAAGGARITPTRPGTPVAGVLVAEPVSEVTPAASYSVKSGDSLWTIARKHNLTVAQLTAANSLSANAPLQPGQKLVIPSRPTVPPSSGSTPAAKAASGSPGTASTRAPGDVVKHVVKSGETLGAIARRYDVRQGDLSVLNNISDPAKIRPGMELVIPGYKAPASKSGKSTKSSSGSTAKAPAPAPFPVPAPEPVTPVVIDPAPAPIPVPAAPPPVPVINIDEAPKQP